MTNDQAYNKGFAAGFEKGYVGSVPKPWRDDSILKSHWKNGQRDGLVTRKRWERSGALYKQLEMFDENL